MLLLLIPYQILFPLLGLALLGRFFMVGRGKTLREGPEEIRQRFGLLNQEELSKLKDGGRYLPVLWIHAASVGEVGAVTPMLRALASRPGRRPRIMLTTSTVTGRERARGIAEIDLAVLAPADFYPAVSTFLSRVRPYGLLLVETELWPMTLYLTQRRGIPIAIVNGRINPYSFAKYGWIRNFVSLFLRGISYAAVQTQEDADRFAALGVAERSIKVTGNLKYDTPAPSEESSRQVRDMLAGIGWRDQIVWVAGSTHPGIEGQSVVETFVKLRSAHPKLRLVLAPRHSERSEESAQILNEHHIRFVTLSSLLDTAGPSHETSVAEVDCILVDRLGQLTSFYSVCDAAFVGGTIAPIGGHNLLEPAIASKPVLFGPHTESTAEIAHALEYSAGGIRVQDAETLGRGLDRLLKDPTFREKTGRLAHDTAIRLSGATERTLQFLSPFL